MNSTMTANSIALQQLVYTWAEQTLTGAGNGVVLRSSAWPTGNSTVADPALADFVEYVPAKFQHRLGHGNTPPIGVDFWIHPHFGHVVAVHRYLGVDSAGREGRSIVHVFVDKERRLDAQDALNLSMSQHIVTDWPLQASPVADAEAVIYQPDPGAETNMRPAGHLIVVLAGIIENLQGKRPIVFTHGDEIEATTLLKGALQVLPRALTRTMTFSTYRGIPQRAKSDITFASTAFSEILPKADLLRTYVPLTSGSADPASDQNRGEIKAISDPAAAMAEALLHQHAVNSTDFPHDISSIADLSQWLRFHRLANEPVDSLNVSDCEALLALPPKTSWVSRQDIIDKLSQVHETSPTQPSTGYLKFLTSDELEALGHTLHTKAAAELESSPSKALQFKRLADSLGFPTKRLVDLSIPVLERLSLATAVANETELKQYVAEIAPLLPHERQIKWAGRPRLREAVLDQWEPTAHAVARRTWTDPEWARCNVEAVLTVARAYPEQSAQVIVSGLADASISSENLDRVTKLDTSRNDNAFDKVFETLFSLPGTGRYHSQPHSNETLPRYEEHRIHASAHFPGRALHQLAPSPTQAPTHSRASMSWTDRPFGSDRTFDSYRGGENPVVAENMPSYDAEINSRRNLETRSRKVRRRLDAAHRRKILRISSVLLSAAAGYSLGATGWHPFVWPPSLLVVLCAAAVMVLPLRRRRPSPKPAITHFLGLKRWFTSKRRKRGVPPLRD